MHQTFYKSVSSLLATPMNRGDYNTYRGWNIPENENPLDEGFLVEQINSVVCNDSRHLGYISWLPKQEFERNCKLATENLSFGDAIEALKVGKKVARSGWNGKGMWLSLSCSDTREVQAEHFWSSHNAQFAKENGGSAKVLPSITMKTATGEILIGWLASQTDMLANDWVIVE